MSDPAPLRALPSVSSLLAAPAARELLASHPREVVLSSVRSLLDRVRAGGAVGGVGLASGRRALEGAILGALPAEVLRNRSLPLRRVINATGVVVHTNLGRAPLAEEAVRAVAEIARGYSNLEYDLDRGGRDSRSVHLDARLRTMTGAEAVHVVNNNAAAILLALAGIARGREVVVSRGELVEIGGSFRIPDVMAESGARLVEVGTTNRTRIEDYARAVTPDTAALLKVHRSNFVVRGFTGEATTAELAALGRERGIPLIEDLGSGAFHPFAAAGIPGAPTVRETIGAGADLVTVSGDKLLGGPQAGILAGRAALVGPLRRHPLSRAMRVDKLCVAALAATLALYDDPRLASAEVPVLRMLLEPESVVRERARRFVRKARARARTLPGGGARLSFAIVPGSSSPGGGAMPEVLLPTACVAVTAPGLAPEALEARLRGSSPPVVARIGGGRLLLDLRTVAESELPELAGALLRAAAPGG